jgi:hypothetical protein
MVLFTRASKVVRMGLYGLMVRFSTFLDAPRRTLVPCCISAPEAPRIWHPTPIAAAESVDLHHGRKRESRGRVQGATHQPHATLIEARTKIPSALVPITTAAPSQPSAQHRSPTNHGLPGIEPEQPDSSSCTSCS